MEVDIFIPCCVDQLYPQVGFDMVKVLEKLEIQVYYNTEQTCCGKTAFKSGYWNDANFLAEKFIKNFNSGRKIVSPSPSCVAMVKNNYSKFFHNSSLHNVYKEVQSNIYEITDFIVNCTNVKLVDVSFPHKIVVHDSCSILRETGLKNETRNLLNSVKGIEIVEMAENTNCCGFGGVFAIKNEAISVSLAEQKVNNAIKAGAEYIVGTEMSCLMQLETYIKKQKLPIKTIHIVELLSKGWDL